MDLLLVRHALPERVEIEDGPADPPLTDHGRRQAVALSEWLEHEHVDAVYTSPMRRALETAVPTAERLGVEAVVEDGLAEMDRDSPVYIPLEELKAENDPRYLALIAGEWEVDPAEFKRTAVAVVERVTTENRGGTVAAFCHGGVINAYVGHVLGIPEPMFFEPAYTSITRLRAASSGPRSLVSVNETAHLRSVGLIP